MIADWLNLCAASGRSRLIVARPIRLLHLFRGAGRCVTVLRDCSALASLTTLSLLIEGSSPCLQPIARLQMMVAKQASS